MATCTSAESVIAAANDIKENAALIDAFTNGTDTETVQLGTGPATPTLRNAVRQMLDIAYEAIEYDDDHPEFLRYYKGADGRFLWGIRIDGTIEWAAGVPKPVREFVEGHGRFVHAGVSPLVERVDDAAGRTMRSMRVDGSSALSGGAEIGGDVSISGSLDCDSIRGVCNWSKASSIKLAEVPKCAVVNITGFYRPLVKTDERKAVMEFWDGRGNYFRKNILIGLQGNSTWNLPKPNYKFDIIKGGWDDIDEEGDVETCEMQIGDWVPSDSFHLKAFYTDFTKCRAIISYRIWEEINRTHGYCSDSTFKRATTPTDEYTLSGALPAFTATEDLSVRMDTGATCRFGGFPCIVYHNGEFYGIFAWQQKKQRGNFAMDGKNAKHVHLDGYTASLCYGYPDYNTVEIRNPKGSQLVCQDGSKYDGDTNMQPLMNSSNPLYDSSNKKHKTSNAVDGEVKALAATLAELGRRDEELQRIFSGEEGDAVLGAAKLAEFKALFESVFDIDNVIDLALQLTWDLDGDSIHNNSQWTTWDGVRWYLNRYDANGAFEGNTPWHASPAPLAHILGGSSYGHPNRFIERYYWDRLCARYAQLRDAKILDADHYVAMVREWMLNVGFDAYEQEASRWPQQDCFGEMEPNPSAWELVLDSGGKPIRCDDDGTIPSYSASAEYLNGDIVKAPFMARIRENTVTEVSQTGFWKVKCVAPVATADTAGSDPRRCVGVLPFSSLRTNAPDSVYRLYNWMKARQAKVDEYLGYKGA